MLIGINGISKSGKDTLADMLTAFGSQKVALADEMKRICLRVYPHMTEDHLWGASERRNEKIKAYPRKSHTYKANRPMAELVGDEDIVCACCNWSWKEGATDEELRCYLTPRYALQLLGTEWGRHCHEDTWVDIVTDAYQKILSHRFDYTPFEGLAERRYPPYEGENLTKMVAVPDLRYRNEMEAIRKAGGKLWRIKRADSGLKGAQGKHTSETEQLKIPDEYFDLVFDNNSTLEALQMHLEYVMKGAI